MGQNAVLLNIVTCRFVSMSRCTLPITPRLTSDKAMDSPKLLVDLSRPTVRVSVVPSSVRGRVRPGTTYVRFSVSHIR